MAHASTSLTPERIRANPPILSEKWGRAAQVLLAVGFAGVLAGFGLGAINEAGLRSFYFAYLVAYCFGLSIALGALFFVILQHLTRSRWSATIRRLAELITASLPMFFVLGLPIVIPMLAGSHELYFWLDPARLTEGSAGFDELVAHKRGFLNIGFFLIRYLAYFSLWTGLAWYFVGRSFRQDKSGDAQLTTQMQRRSAPAMLGFALTLTFFSIDFIMSLDAHWFSTIIGVYFFAGCLLALCSFLALSGILLNTQGLLRGVVTIEHYHDLGKLMFAFTLFWGYIAFSQYMLYWYANMPEETAWYLRRQSGEWLAWSIALIFLNLFIPLLGLLSRHVKRRKRFLSFWAIWLLIVHWIDLFWLIKPEFSVEHVAFGVIDVVCLIGVLGVMLGTILYAAKGRPLVAINDPYLLDGLEFENV